MSLSFAISPYIKVFESSVKLILYLLTTAEPVTYNSHLKCILQ